MAWNARRNIEDPALLENVLSAGDRKRAHRRRQYQSAVIAESNLFYFGTTSVEAHDGVCLHGLPFDLRWRWEGQGSVEERLPLLPIPNPPITTQREIRDRRSRISRDVASGELQTKVAGDEDCRELSALQQLNSAKPSPDTIAFVDAAPESDPAAAEPVRSLRDASRPRHSPSRSDISVARLSSTWICARPDRCAQPASFPFTIAACTVCRVLSISARTASSSSSRASFFSRTSA
jgi:hypothetical protein